jgi:TonB family protein
MSTYPAALAVGACLLLSAAPAYAGQSMTMGAMLVADIGRDDAALNAGPRVDARLIEAAIPEWSYFDTAASTSGLVVVAVRLNESGKVVGAKVARSSGWRTLDISAVNAVRDSKYAPGMLGGRPVGGTYAVDVEFDRSE